MLYRCDSDHRYLWSESKQAVLQVKSSFTKSLFFPLCHSVLPSMWKGNFVTVSWAITSSTSTCLFDYSHLLASFLTHQLVHDIFAEWCISQALSWFKRSHHFSKSSLFWFSFLCPSDGTASGRKVLLAFKFYSSYLCSMCGHRKK